MCVYAYTYICFFTIYIAKIENATLESSRVVGNWGDFNLAQCV